MLGALDGFDPARDAVPVAELQPIDRWALSRLAAWDEKVKAAYEDYEFHVAFHATMQLCAVELSALYFDVIKDRLYTWRRDGKPRRSAQTALHAIAQDVIRLLAPVLSFTATDAWGHLPGRRPRASGWPGSPSARAPPPTRTRSRHATAGSSRSARWCRGSSRRPAARSSSAPGSRRWSTLRAEGEQLRLLEEARAELPALFIVSKVVLEDGPLAVEVARAPGVKCERCWIYAEDVGADPAHPTVCGKCAGNLA